MAGATQYSRGTRLELTRPQTKGYWREFNLDRVKRGDASECYLSMRKSIGRKWPVVKLQGIDDGVFGKEEEAQEANRPGEEEGKMGK